MSETKNLNQKKSVEYILFVVAITFFIIIISLLYYLGYFKNILNSQFNTKTLTAKPILSADYVKNPDIIHSSYGWLSETPESLEIDTTLLNVSSDWKGNAYVAFSRHPLEERVGVAIIYPVDPPNKRYIEQSLVLPVLHKYVVRIGVANSEGMDPYTTEGAGSCADVGVRVIVKDNTKNKQYTVFNKIVKNDGWHDYSINLGSRFNEHNITLSAESYATDQGCGLWNGEWATIDYIDIIQQ